MCQVALYIPVAQSRFAGAVVMVMLGASRAGKAPCTRLDAVPVRRGQLWHPYAPASYRLEADYGPQAMFIDMLFSYLRTDCAASYTAKLDV